jgi:hypothetical protein
VQVLRLGVDLIEEFQEIIPNIGVLEWRVMPCNFNRLVVDILPLNLIFGYFLFCGVCVAAVFAGIVVI